MNKKKKRILIIRCGRLGDTAISSVVLNPIRHMFKNAEIDWLTKTEVADIFEYEKDVKTIKLNRTSIPLLFDIKKLSILIKSLFKPYDAIFNLEVSKKYDYLVKFIKSSKKFGRPYHHIPDNRTEHRAIHQMRIINECNIDYPEQIAVPSLKCPPLEMVSKKISPDKGFIVVSPSTSKFKKKTHRGYRNWTNMNWKRLISMILEKTNYDVIITGTKNDYNVLEELYSDSVRIKNYAGKLSLPEYATIIKYAQYVIGVDSATVHVASAVGSKKIIALYGPTYIKASQPYETRPNQVSIITKNLPCSPCYGTDVIENCQVNLCMRNIVPADVMDIIITS